MSALSVAGALAEARARGIARLDAQVLLAHFLGATRAELIAHDERLLAREQVDAWQAAIERRASGVPLAYLLGTKEFHGLRLAVTPDVLVPRPETELLVDWALECIARGGTPSPAVLDLGTGSGAVALAIKHGHPRAVVKATDTSPAALALARANASRLGLNVDFCEGSWWHAVEARTFDVIASNPPYVAAGDPHLAALRHEPLAALVPGPGGLEAIAEIAAGAAAHLRPGGWLLVEHGYDQGEPARALLTTYGLANVRTRADLAGLERVTGGQRGDGP